MPKHLARKALSHEQSWQVSRSTFSNFKQARDWKIHAYFAQRLFQVSRGAHADHTLPSLHVRDTVYALDTSTVCLRLSLVSADPGARFCTAMDAVKLHAHLDLHGNIPAFIQISVGKLHDVSVLGTLIQGASSFYVMNRADLDFGRLHHLHLYGGFFVLRANSNTRIRCIYSRPRRRQQRSRLRTNRTDG